ncbi:ATP-dependent DNA helicase DinG [Bacillus sp. SG-1]|uniref:ATP-dependent DNA helicase DinG n=1 Tax=Bacillus sp. SG-1 TaxID=161544 RepID=UPI0001544D5D|nr:ATP-dependent DNA helicase DinG [Bacillus sp. SG-1]EDL63377.1 bifunctional ATP-dependent DNA helicase/DNA polymerase III subunit epsilon [Bacillus sp. SG-1]
MVPHKIVVVDLETTGNSPKKGDKIIQLAAMVVQGGAVVDSYTTFVNPGITIPSFIEELTGIHDGMVKDAPEFSEIAPKVLELLDGAVFCAHNVQFDLGFLQAELEEAGYNPFSGPSFDTVELAKITLPTADSYKLTELSDRFSLNHSRPHQADSDALVTAELLIHFIEKLAKLPLVTLEQLEKLSTWLKSDLSLLFSNILTEKRRSISDINPDLEVFRGIALRVKADLPQADFDLSEIHFPVEEKDKTALLSSTIAAFEKRDGQFLMMDKAYEAMTESKHMIIEAGTGVGKSLGYLLPAIFYSKQQGVPVVLSTYTIQLQEQLLSKEINFLKGMLDFSFHAVLLKGKNHYLNLFKFEQSLTEDENHYDIAITKMQILVWLTITETGDVDELNLTSGGRLFWNRIRHDGWHIKKDPWIGRDFYLHARNMSKKADLIITNHSMLLADLVNEKKLLPAYDTVIIDEAHHLEKSARTHFGKVIDYLSAKFVIGQLGALDQRQLFHKLENMLEKYAVKTELHSFELDQLVNDFYREIEECFSVIISLFLKHSKRRKGIQKIQMRLTHSLLKSSEWMPAVMSVERVISGMKKIEAEMNSRLRKLKEKENALDDSEKASLEEFYSFMVEWSELRLNFRDIFVSPSEMDVIWLEGDMRSLPNSLMIQSQLSSVGEKLKQSFFDEKQCAIMTSATLTVQNSFQYFQEELGLSGQEVDTVRISSPFQYNEMTKLFIPTDVPEIQNVSLDEYVEAIATHLIGVAQATKGRMLVLFTAFDMLRKTHDLMKDSGLLEDFVLMAQGISSGSRTRLTKNFQRFDKAILFGTSSFWEGVDIPGEDLSCLVLVRLPFSPPDEPVAQAKSDLLKNEGKNPFSHYSLPEAILRFKQGVGRLIRRSTDRGIVIVFDRRIITARYGKAFLDSIPDMPVRQGELHEMVELIEEWL